MPPNGTSNGTRTSEPQTRKRSVPGRVVPAIPLPFTKPKPKPVKEETVHQAETKNETVDIANTKEKVEENIASKVNGEHVSPKPAANAAQELDVESKESTSSTPVSSREGLQPASNTATPESSISEAAPRQTARTATQTSASSAATSAASSRKPTNRQEMRHIRTELPPAFVPASEQQQSATQGPRNMPLHAHPHHASTNSIVFGGMETSGSPSPALPLSGGSVYTPPHANMQPPFYPPHSGYSNPFSQPQMQQMYSHGGYGPPSGQWNSMQNVRQQSPQAQHFQPNGQAHFRYPQSEPFTPSGSMHTNGYSHSRSGSQASSAGPVKSGDESRSDNATERSGRTHDSKGPFFQQSRQPRYSHPQMAPPHMQMLNYGPIHDLGDEENLSSYLQSQFANRAFVDCQLQITNEQNGDRHQLDGHKLIFSRSLTLRKLIQDSTSTKLPMNLKSPYLHMRTFIESVQYLYGGPLAQLEDLQMDYAGRYSNAMSSNAERMETAVQYIAAGAYLSIPSITNSASEAAGKLLHWDTISIMLGFALDGGLSQNWFGEDHNENNTLHDSRSNPTYDPYATDLLHHIMYFMTHAFPSNFYLDASAPQIAACARLPSPPLSHRSRPSTSDPRLSKIRFGEISEDDHQRPSALNTTLSSVLFTLPFPLLKSLLEHPDLAGRLGPDTVASIMRQVVAEREARRVKALQARSAGKQDNDVDQQQLQNLHFAETVEESVRHRAGFMLARSWQGAT